MRILLIIIGTIIFFIVTYFIGSAMNEFPKITLKQRIINIVDGLYAWALIFVLCAIIMLIYAIVWMIIE
jgi:hypothetical protein